MSLKNKLARMKNHLSNDNDQDVRQIQDNRSLKSSKREIPFLETWESECVTPFYLDDQYCLIREVTYPLSHYHGRYRLADFVRSIKIWNEKNLNHPLSANGFQPEELFFFDTETTGLGGGVGNTIFLLGYASVKGDQLVLRQHILPSPSGEVALYQSFLEKVNYKTLVTYNGKSFDWPQVKTRHTLVRDHVPKLPQFGHFDLYHSARRMWKHKLDRLKLSVVEEEVLGVRRENDIPGYLAPMIYFDFVESKDPTGMVGVLKHNEIDILSLVTLYTHLTFQILGQDPLQTRREQYEIGRWFSHIGENSEAVKAFHAISDGDDWSSQQAKLALAFQAKKEKKWDLALDLFGAVAKHLEQQNGIEASIEAAKIYEHRLKDYPMALKYCVHAEQTLNKGAQEDDFNLQKQRKQLQARMARLEMKLRKFPG